MPSFNYLATHTLVANLELGLSSNRLARYTALAGGDKAVGLALYSWNAEIAEALYRPLQALEVLTRNRFHDLLRARWKDDWYNNGAVVLAPAQQMALIKAIDTLKQEKKVVSPPSIVAELSFGFWTGLLGHRYDQSLWRVELYKPFRRRYGTNSRSAISADYSAMRLLRNRVAHHECVIDQNLPAQYAIALDLIRTMCPDTASWVQHHSRFDAAWRVPENPWLPKPAP